MKYIVKNCPAILKMSKVCDDYRTTRDNPQLCKDITDCLLKRIVENLKTVINSNLCKNCDGCGYDYGCKDANCGYYQARKCWELFETKECENE